MNHINLFLTCLKDWTEGVWKTCWSSKLMYLLHVEEYKKTV